jgi:hypothetical protein
MRNYNGRVRAETKLPYLHRLGVISRRRVTDPVSNVLRRPTILRGVKSSNSVIPYADPHPRKNNCSTAKETHLASELKHPPQPLFTVFQLQQIQKKYYNPAIEDMKRQAKEIIERWG